MKKFLLATIVMTFLWAAHAMASEPVAVDISLNINGSQTSVRAYNFFGNNYFKLRDIASLLNGTEKQFNVSYSDYTGIVYISPGKAYTSYEDTETFNESDTEIVSVFSTSLICFGSGLNDHITFVGYNVNGNNFFKLRDLAWFLDFDVEYNSGTIYIDTALPYEIIASMNDTRSEVIGEVCEADLPLFTDEVPLRSYYSTNTVVYNDEQSERIRKFPRLNGVYIKVSELPDHSFDVYENGNEVFIIRNSDKQYTIPTTEFINSKASDKRYVRTSSVQVYLDGEPVNSIDADGYLMIPASELMRYGDIEPIDQWSYAANQTPIGYTNGRINIDIWRAELEREYDSAGGEVQITQYPIDERPDYDRSSGQLEYKPSVGLGEYSIYEYNNFSARYIGQCSGFSRDGYGIYNAHDATMGGLDSWTRYYYTIERGLFDNDRLIKGISYTKQHYSAGLKGGRRIEGDRVNGYMRESVMDDDFRFGYRVVCEGDIKNSEYCGAYKAYDENGQLIYAGLYSDPLNPDLTTDIQGF